MHALTLAAECVAVEHPDGVCHLVGFADSTFNTKRYLMLQRDFEGVADEQDIELGLDTYYVEWCGQENSGYSGISRFVLHQGGAEVTFTPEGVENLNGLERLAISFRLTPSEHAALREALGHIFHDCGCLVLADA